MNKITSRHLMTVANDVLDSYNDIHDYNRFKALANIRREWTAIDIMEIPFINFENKFRAIMNSELADEHFFYKFVYACKCRTGDITSLEKGVVIASRFAADCAALELERAESMDAVCEVFDIVLSSECKVPRGINTKKFFELAQHGSAGVKEFRELAMVRDRWTAIDILTEATLNEFDRLNIILGSGLIDPKTQREYICRCAEHVFGLSKKVDPLCYDAIAAVRKWNNREVKHDELKSIEEAVNALLNSKKPEPKPENGIDEYVQYMAAKMAHLALWDDKDATLFCARIASTVAKNVSDSRNGGGFFAEIMASHAEVTVRDILIKLLIETEA